MKARNHIWGTFKDSFKKANHVLLEYQVLRESKVTISGCQYNLENKGIDQVLDCEVSALKDEYNLVTDSSEYNQEIISFVAPNSSFVRELISIRNELAACKDHFKMLSEHQRCAH